MVLYTVRDPVCDSCNLKWNIWIAENRCSSVGAPVYISNYDKVLNVHNDHI